MTAPTDTDVIRFALKPMSIRRNGEFVKVGRGEPLTRAEIAATFTPERLAARDGLYLSELPPSPTNPASLTAAQSRESARHAELRLALESLVERFAAGASIERAPVREALDAGAGSVTTSGVTLDLPTELTTLFNLAAAELKKIEKREATK